MTTHNWTISTPYLSAGRVSSGVNTPKALRDQGIYLANNYTAHRWRRSSSDLKYQFVNAYGTILPTIYETIPGFANGSALPPIPELAEVLPQLLESWRASDFNAGVSIAEGGKSIDGIVERLRSIRQAVRDVKRGNIGQAVRHLGSSKRNSPRASLGRARKRLDVGDLTGVWLEMRYHWRPVISDVKGLIDTIRVEPKKKVVRTSKKNVLKDSFFITPTWITNDAKSVAESTRYLIVEVQGPPLWHERIGMTDPLSVAWELTPLSFMADWFLPIGDTLSAWHAIRAMPIVSVCDTTVQKYQVSGRAQSSSSRFYHIPYSGQVFSSKSTEMVRECSTSLPSAWSLLEGIPQRVKSNWDPDLKKLADAAAITYNIVKGLGLGKTNRI